MSHTTILLPPRSPSIMFLQWPDFVKNHSKLIPALAAMLSLEIHFYYFYIDQIVCVAFLSASYDVIQFLIQTSVFVGSIFYFYFQIFMIIFFHLFVLQFPFTCISHSICYHSYYISPLPFAIFPYFGTP